MAVPAHDSRDHDFALNFNIPIKWVLMPVDKSSVECGKAFSGDGILENSSDHGRGIDINGLSSKEAATRVIMWAEKSGNGRKKVLESRCLPAMN